MEEQIMKNNKNKKYERDLSKRGTCIGNMNKLSSKKISILSLIHI